MAHAKRSPSSHKRWGGRKGCRASIMQSEGKPNKSSEAAFQGSAEHLVCERCLTTDHSPIDYLGRTVVFYSAVDSTDQKEGFVDEVNTDTVTVAKTVTLDDEAIDRVDQFVAYVRDRVEQTGGTLHVEVKVPIDHITGEEGASGTSDVVIVWSCGTVYEVIDYKGGSGRVYAYEYVKHKVVDAETGEILSPDVLEPNGQLAMYASGALRMLDLMDEAKTIRLTIIQPRIHHVSDFTISRLALDEFVAKTQEAAKETYSDAPTYNPSADNCFFCPGRFDCTARESLVLATVIEGFPNLDDPKQAPIPASEGYDLGTLLPIAAIAKKWADDVESAALAALDNGKVLTHPSGLRYKLVTGRKGHRAWTDSTEVEALAEQMRLSGVMFSRSLITPAAAEKLTATRRRKGEQEAEKPAIGPTQWKRLASLITQPDGKAEIALETDPRPARHTLDFECETAPEATAPAASGIDDLFSV